MTLLNTVYYTISTIRNVTQSSKYTTIHNTSSSNVDRTMNIMKATEVAAIYVLMLRNTWLVSHFVVHRLAFVYKKHNLIFISCSFMLKNFLYFMVTHSNVYLFKIIFSLITGI